MSSRIAVEAPRLQNLVDTKPASLKALQDAMRAERFEIAPISRARRPASSSGTSGRTRSPSATCSCRGPQVMSKVASLQKSLSDRNATFDETTARELFLYPDSAGAGADSQRAARHHSARGPELRAVPGVPESGGRPLSRRTFSDQLRAERDGPARIQAFHDAGGRPSVRCRRSGDCGCRRRGRVDRQAVSRPQPGRLGHASRAKAT